MRKKKILSETIKWILLICIPVFYFFFGIYCADGTFFSKIRILFTIILCVFAILSVYFLFESKIPLWKNAFISIIVLGMVYSLLIPVGSAPDEVRHSQTAYYISDVLLGNTNSKHTVEMREEDADNTSSIMDSAAQRYNPEQYEMYWKSLNDKAQKTKVVKTDYYPLHSNPMAYCFSGFGITIGRILHLGTNATYMLARVLNLLFAAFCISLAISITPIAKELFFVVALLPMTLQQIMSLSYDMLTISLAFLVTALSLHIYFEKTTKKNFLKEFCILAILAACLASLKSGAYIFMLLLPIYILGVRYCKNKKRVLWFGIIFGITIVFVGFVFLVYLHGHPSILPEGKTYLDWADQYGPSLTYVLHHPRETLIRFWATYLYLGQYYFEDTLIGTSLGFSTYYTNVFFQFAFTGLIICCLANEETDKELSLKMRLLMLFIFVVSVNAILLVFLITFTPFGSLRILGGQGRYFLPVLLVGLLTFYGAGYKRDKKLSPYLCYAGILLNIMSIRWFLFPY